MKITVTGATGMLGRAVMERLKDENDCEVLGFCHSRKADGLKAVDLTDEEATVDALDGFSPDVIIHTAAIRKPDEFAADEDKANRLNVDATRTLAKWVAGHPSSYMIYISSDYVFNGVNAPYFPDSEICPVNAYGVSKAKGEEVCKELAAARTAVLRVPVLYGDVETLDESSVTSVFAQVKKNEKCVMDDWAVRYPTHVANVADVLVKMASKRLAGTFQWSGKEAMTKLDMAFVAADILGVDKNLFAGSGAPANGSEPRPKDCHLDRSALEKEGVSTDDIPFAVAARKILGA